MADYFTNLFQMVYTPRGIRGVYTYTGSHSKTIVFGLLTADGEGFFQKYAAFTKEEFVKFSEGGAQKVRQDPDDNRRRPAAQGKMRRGGARTPRRLGAGIFCHPAALTLTRSRRYGAR